ncbi:ATP synthase subunit I [Proteiniphilum sp.]|uniref:ATP synthase subunit I n=1 Tax=Proteiniphilum sp. TaxID=1926877 RepID=UPI002B209F7C|nr:ATP synthase subunit I [Proteiniphilum sp.]MEA4916429.1 ATP synthase subunit I [Proteiniphilum sp.]
MWNKLLLIISLTGLIAFSDLFSQDSVIVESGETFVDSLQVVLPEINVSLNTNKIFPGGLTQSQRDSIINAIPKDTSSPIIERRFKESLADKYRSDNALNYERNISKSFFQRFKEIISTLLDKLLGRTNTSKINKLSNRILNVLLGIIFLAALYIAVRLFMNHRGRWFFEKRDEVIFVNLSNVEKHIHEADFATLLREAEQSGDTRQSIRLLYLWVLKIFTDNNVIEWNPDKTNIDYLSEVQDKALQEQFRYLSYLYNYIWYGGFSINDSEYRNARETFLRHIKTKPEDE